MNQILKPHTQTILHQSAINKPAYLLLSIYFLLLSPIFFIGLCELDLAEIRSGYYGSCWMKHGFFFSFFLSRAQ